MGQFTSTQLQKKLKKASQTLIAVLLMSAINNICLGQKPLTNSRQSSYYTYIYKLNAYEVLNFYKNPEKPIDEKILHNPIDSFKTDSENHWVNHVPKGNYLKVYIEKNELKYKLIENHSAWLKDLANGYDLRFVFIDNEQNIIPERVLVNDKPVDYDSKSGSWHIKFSKRDTIIQAKYNGVDNFFSVKRQKRYRYSRYQYDSFFEATWKRIKERYIVWKDRGKYPQRYTGFITFNKPIYKPRDTVKFKAFIFKVSSRKPIKTQELLIRLKQRYGNDNGKVIGKVKSYREGGFEYGFALTDSLKLDLDDNYAISLEAPSSAKYDLDKYDGDDDEAFLAKRKVYITGNFRFEDYELKATRFTMRADKAVHSPGNPLAVYLKATDENDLPVPDGRIRLSLIVNNVERYKSNTVFVPDTLWKHQMPLEPAGETKLVIPDSIFPDADLDYRILATFLNSSNESREAMMYEKYKAEKYQVNTKLTGDSLVSSFIETGKEKQAQAVITGLGHDGNDTILQQKVTLPYKLKINPNVARYEVAADSANSQIELNKSNSGITASGYRTEDSLFVNIKNERKLHFWYSVFAGSSLIDCGQADTLFYKRYYHGSDIITFLVNYVWGGQSLSESALVDYNDKILNISVKQPVSVYPGQRAETTIVVTDVKGNPVPNTDVTAWSLTKKFEDVRPPFVPYLGKSHRARKSLLPLNIIKLNNEGSTALNWDLWSRRLGLDSITYFKFTHPLSVYKIEEQANDTITQVAPFVVKEGGIVPVHILYIDSRPVYFSQAQQLQRYSFRVSPGRHSIRFRTVDQDILMDSVIVEKSKKLILSVDANAPSGKVISIGKMPDTLTRYEANLINKYMVSVVNNFGYKQAEIEQDKQLILLNPVPNFTNHYNGYNNVYNDGNILTGPLANNYTLFKLRGDAARMFEVEPGYSYLFEPGLLKQKSIPARYPFNTRLSNSYGTSDFKQYPLTQHEADSIWQNVLDLRSNTTTLFANRPVTSKFSGKLKIGFQFDPKKQQPFIKNIVVYRYDNPDFIRVYEGNTTDFEKLDTGKYRLLFLLKGDYYDIIDNITVKPFGLNYYKLSIAPSHPRDSVSIKINNIISNRMGEYSPHDDEIANDALKLKEAFNDKYFDNSNFEYLMSGTVTGSDDGLPIPGATVKIKGTNIGIQTNASGKYRLKVPSRGKLVFSSIGYQTREIEIEQGATVNVKLVVSSSQLNEVVVTALGIQRQSMSLGYSISNGLSGKAAGVSIVEQTGATSKIMIRGLNTVGGAEPLIVLDGEIVKDFPSIKPEDVSDISVLKDAAATALYGSRAANGVVIITTKNKANSTSTPTGAQQNNELSIRKNFSDYAYWQPKLTTDENGRASFTTTFPDDITNWRTFVTAVNDKRQTGFAEQQIKSFKPLSATLIAPAFAVAGDELSAIGKVMNYGADPVTVTRSFSYNNKLINQNELNVKNSKIDTLNITAAGKDSLTFEYSIKRDNGYFDGERRKIPVIEQGVKETVGEFKVLNGDTTVNLKFNKSGGAVTFRAEASLLPAMAEEAQRLRDYKYLCNEQLASKLEGLLAEKRINTYLGQPFKYQTNVEEIIKKLHDNRKSNGTWGWWQDSEEELWISLHAIEALADAENAGYFTNLDKTKITEYLVYQLESYKGNDKLTCLQILQKLKAKVDYSKYAGVIEEEFAKEKQVSKYNRFRLMLLKQQAGLSVKLDSVLTTEKHTLFGNIYWGEDNYNFFNNSTQLSILAYQIIKNDGKNPELLQKIKGYLLEQRKSNGWRNTYETSLILTTLLPDLLVKEKEIKPSRVIIKGPKTDTVTKFPYSVTLAPVDLSISKTGSLPVYITGYQQFWNSNPVNVDKDFAVNTWFEKSGNKISQLKGGQAVTLKIEVNAKGDGDYVMIEVPIPAGCSYENKQQAWSNNEVHREYFKEKVCIFCRKLTQGKHEFTINLMPRYDGKYTLNPAKAELMYFPVFYGREQMKSVAIKN